MLKIQEIRELIRLVDQSNLDEFEYECDDTKIKMKKRIVSQVETVKCKNQSEMEVVQVPKAEEPAEPKVEVQKREQTDADEPSKEIIDDTNLYKITSPMVGTFYQAPNPNAEPYVKVGNKVKKDTIVCIVEAMKLFNEIEAEVEGEIVEVLVKDGQLVEYGQPLFLVKPE